MAGPLASLKALTGRPCAHAARWLGLAAAEGEDAPDASDADDDAVLDAVSAALDAAYERATALSQLSRALAPIEVAVEETEEKETAAASTTPSSFSFASLSSSAYFFIALCFLSAASYLATWGAAKAVACGDEDALRSPAGALTAPLLPADGVVVAADHVSGKEQFVRITVA